MATPTVPGWLTTEFFQSCLQGHDNHQPITVTNYIIKPSDIPDGNNYGSQLLRVKVEYSYTKEDAKSSIFLVIKVPLSNIEQMMGEIYEREVKFYAEFVNETYKFSNHDLVPKHYNSPHPRCVVLEDLSISGYKMVDRHTFLNFEHCQLFIKAKAKLHALSVAVYNNNPKIIESLVYESPTNKENSQKMTKLMIEGCLRCMIAYLEDNGVCGKYFEVIKEASKNDNMWKMYEEVDQSCSDKPLKALIQLDPWCTNMMFKYDSLGKVKHIKLLDFQGIAFSSPLKEIVTFLTVSPNMEVRKTKLNNLYQLYFDTLNENLAELGCPQRLNFEEMKAEIVAMGPMVLFLVIGGVPMLIAEEAADINEYLSGNILNAPVRESPIYKLYQGTTFCRLFPQFLDAINEEGVFDYVQQKMNQLKPL